ncbi:MAG: hypothetical protein ACO3LE_03905 [Bdellovibrionota bacterium]
MEVKEMNRWFSEKIKLITDPYFDREFFTNLIFCLDRKKTLREIFEESLVDFNSSPNFSEEFDKSLFQLLVGYQSSQFLRESYQILPLAQALYAAALYRSEGRSPIVRKNIESAKARGSSLDEFEKMLSFEAREVTDFQRVWSSLLFLLQSRSNRTEAVKLVLNSAARHTDRLSFRYLVKSFEICFSSSWEDAEIFLQRPFERFWNKSKALPKDGVLRNAEALVLGCPTQLEPGRGMTWPKEWSEELWYRVSKQTGESAWEHIDLMSKQGASLDQVEVAVQLMFARCLFFMKPHQWSLVADSMLYAEALRSMGRWSPESRKQNLAACVLELSFLTNLICREEPSRPTGASVVEKFSQNLGKNQLILRLDDAIETSDSEKAFDLAAVILKDRGLSHSLCDRLLLMASKQDAWSYSMMTLPIAYSLANSFEVAVRLQLSQDLLEDAAFGLTNLFLQEREFSLAQVKKQGNYGDGGLKISNFDVSGGARIVDRFVFNQLRNAQRIFIWPTEGKG